MDDPDMGHWIYDYDLNGNLIYQKDAKNQEMFFRYDELNRIRQKDYGTQQPLGSGDIVYTYDETFSTNFKGRLTTLSDASGTTKFYYDKLGRTTKTIKTIDSVPYTTETTYDALGRTNTIRYPDNPVTEIKYEYDTGGNLYRVKNNSTSDVYATYTNYNAVGQIGRTDYGNGVNTTYQYYYQNNRLSSITTNSPTQSGLMNISYDLYDNAGNIKTITDHLNSTRTRTFKYDDLNRLTEANNTTYYGGTLVYQYDKIGNMTYNCKYGYYYYDTNHKHAVTRVVKNGVTTNYAYDDNGNMTSGDGRALTYDYDNRPTRITYGSTYVDSVYDAGGSRVKKTTPNGTTVYIGQLYECTSGQCTKYIFAGNQRIASKSAGGTYYYHTDHLGSSNIITAGSDVAGKQAGDILEDLFYYPYGERNIDNGSISVKHKFTGQELDAETGLYYYGARYYDPKLARFISADTIVPDFSDPQTLNRFSYTRNNPVIYTDPSGHLFGIDDILIGAAIGALVGGTVSAFTGGDIGMGMLTGAISGAFFGAVGGYIQGAEAAGHALSSVTQAGLHAGAGAISGGINAAITRGDVGMGMLTGGISGGLSKFAGGYLPKGFGYQLAGRSLIGGVTGGITAELYGGDFWSGFAYGAETAVIGYLANELLHPMIYKGLASWYPKTDYPTASGEPYDENALTGAMTGEKVRLGTTVTVEYDYNDGETGKKATASLQVKINDRGPFKMGPDGKAIYPLQPHSTRIIDLSPAAFQALTGDLKLGVVPVRVIVP